MKITEVFKIEMWYVFENTFKNIRYPNLKVIQPNGTKTISIQQTTAIAKRDGFSSAEQMFKTLDKMYDLKQAKQFWIYRWRWIK